MEFLLGQQTNKETRDPVPDTQREGRREKTSQVAQQELDIFNNGFVQYEGKRSGSQVKALMSSVINNNNQNGESGNNVPEKIIEVISGGKTVTSVTDLTTIRASIVAGKQYSVAIGYNTQGYVHTITITDLSGSGTGGAN